MTQIEYRSYMPGDEHAILALFRESFGSRTMTMDYWKWRFRENPVGQILIELAWDGDKLAAHYGVSPVLMSIQGKDALCGLSVTTMTHPHYRGRGLFPVLADRLYRRMAETGYLMVWGFPNKNSHEGFVSRLGWRDICEIPMLRLDLGKMKHRPERTAKIGECTVFDDGFNQLWASVSARHAIAVKRDATYLRWRFQSNPENKYQLICYKDDDQLLGYAVWKLYQGTDLEIIDLVAVEQETVGTALVAAAVETGLGLGAESVKMWLPRHNPLRANLERTGFREGPPMTFFGARSFDSVPYGTNWSAESAWFYSMSDSDVF
ncbi:MAG: GNAT family N-acetyltransferase [Desulfomonile tiedjei]|nr:GNAT family N-acetyltransferase [Desulfomonile tiedjei]